MPTTPTALDRHAEAVLGPTLIDPHLRKQLRFSIAISATRCLLTYLVLPVLSPLVQPALAHSPRIFIPFSVAALFFDARAIRIVFRSDHRWRWKIICGYTLLIIGITALIAHDIWQLAH